MTLDIWMLLILVINFGISWLNCVVCGKQWVETKILGGFPRLLVWCGVIQAAVGFSMVFLVLILLIAQGVGYLPPEVGKLAMSIWYLAIIVPALGSGLIITIQSWVVAFRERSMLNIGTAAWNTYAQLSNMYHAVDGVGRAVGNIAEAFGDALEGDDSNNVQGKLIVVAGLLVLIALLAGALLTAVLVKRYAATDPVILPQRREAVRP